MQLKWHDLRKYRKPSYPYPTQQANYAEHTAQHVVVVPPPPIHGYTAVKASLFHPDKEETICLDTGSTTTFMDKALAYKANAQIT